MKFRKIIAFLLSFIFVFSISLSASADGFLGEMPTLISGMNNLTVSSALKEYFAERESFLQGLTDSIPRVLSGILNDEDTHKDLYSSRNIVLLDTSYTIDSVTVFENRAEALVTECVTYSIGEIVTSSVVAHTIRLALSSSNEIIVTADGYVEEFSGFRSCAYVDESAIQTTSTGGSSKCIISVAEREVGTQETGDDLTDYGAWFGWNGVPWCAIFVAWCADEAEIATSIIPKSASPVEIMTFLQDQNRFYYSPAFEGTTAPQAGDLFFCTEDDSTASHIGIIRYVDASNIYVVHGNWSNEVRYDTFSRTSSDILGFGRPAYASLGHSLLYQSNSSSHWLACNNCEHEYDSEPHAFVRGRNESQHWFQCEVCSYQEGQGAHTFESSYSSNSNKHWKYCTECSYRGDYSDHVSSKLYSWDSTFHWKDCTTCGYDMTKENHTFVQSGTGGAYVCSGCGYTTNTPILGIPTTPVLPYSFSDD